MNFKNKLLLFLLLNLVRWVDCLAQNITIIYGDSIYMDKTNQTNKITYEDTAIYTIKSNFLDKNYIVLSENKNDTLMIITDSISSFFSNQGLLYLQTLKYNNIFFARINYDYAPSIGKASKRIIISHPTTESQCASYYFDFDENWSLLNYFTDNSLSLHFSISNASFDSFGSFLNGEKDGAWLFLSGNIAKRIDLYNSGKLIYTLSLNQN